MSLFSFFYIATVAEPDVQETSSDLGKFQQFKVQQQWEWVKGNARAARGSRNSLIRVIEIFRFS
jgi:hypothetical protein